MEEGTTALVIGNGIYTLADVARYTQMPDSRVRSWFRIPNPAAVNPGPTLSADFRGERDEPLASFHDLIDALVVGRLRVAGVSMQTVRAAHAILKRELVTPHPFCRAEIFTDGQKVFLQVNAELRDTTLSEVISRQGFSGTVLMPYLKRVDYAVESKMAERWRLYEGVVIDPKLRFGQPIVDGTGISTYVLAAQYKANKNNENLVADLFDVTTRDVLNAVSFEEKYSVRLAA